MARENKYTIKNLRAQFPNDNVCLEFTFDALHSRECSCGGMYKKIPHRRQYQCSKCRFQIAPTAGTIFHKSTTPLTDWFYALFLFSNAKSGISAKQLERQLGMTYKCAWRILSQIRKALKAQGITLDGEVEMDSAYFGGRGRGGKYNKNQKQVMRDKSVVFAAIEREGNVKASVMPDNTARSHQEFLRDSVKQGTTLYTDKTNRLEHAAFGYKRESVDHGRGEHVRGKVHVNAVESFWSHVKRSIRGTHKSVSKKYLQDYLNGFAFLRNNRHNDKERFAVLLGTILQSAR